jgi:hypothetical protein
MFVLSYLCFIDNQQQNIQGDEEMFKAKQTFVRVFDDSTGYEEDLGMRELGYVTKIIIELSFDKWIHGSKMGVKVIKCTSSKEGRKAFLVYDRWFYDDTTRDEHLALPMGVHPMLVALTNNEARGATAENMAELLFWEAVHLDNFFKKFLPEYWQANVERGFIIVENFPEPSSNPENWMKPQMVVPYA